MLMLIPDIINQPTEIVKDIVDLVSLLLLPIGLWIINQILGLKERLKDLEHKVAGVDGKNGLQSKVENIYARLDKISTYHKLIIRLLRRNKETGTP